MIIALSALSKGVSAQLSTCCGSTDALRSPSADRLCSKGDASLSTLIQQPEHRETLMNGMESVE